jgi:hypothetical protein
VPLNASGMALFMIIIHMRFDFSHLSISLFSSEVLSSLRGGGESVLNARSRSITPRTIKRLSFQDLKLEPLSIGIELILAVILAGLIAEKRTTTIETSSQTKLILREKINSNKGKTHLKISGTPLIFYLWIKD